jgi:hypothetical protein
MRFSCARVVGSIALALLPRALPAQTVTVPPIDAPMSKHGTPIYFGRYVANLMDFGFVYLDTQALTAGFIDVLGKCAIPQLSPASNLWTALDCNGVTTLGFAANTLVVNNGGASCAALRVGSCSGVPFNKKYAFGFAPGTWAYDKAWNTQVAATNAGPDSQGRFWELTCSTPGPNPTNCVWTVIGGGPTPTPAPTLPPGTPSRTPVVPPSPTPTVCNLPPWGQPGPFGRCYDCAGNVVGDQPCGPKTATPAPSLTAARTRTRTATAALATVTATATCPPCPTLPGVPTVPFRTPTAPSGEASGIPTGAWVGLGALAAILIGWFYRRLRKPPDTPENPGPPSQEGK